MSRQICLLKSPILHGSRSSQNRASDQGRIVFEQTENRITEQANLPSQFSYSPCGKIVAKSCFRPFVSFVVGCCKFTTPKSWTRSSQNRASDRCKHRFAGGCVQHNPSRNCQMLQKGHFGTTSVICASVSSMTMPNCFAMNHTALIRMMGRIAASSHEPGAAILCLLESQNRVARFPSRLSLTRKVGWVLLGCFDTWLVARCELLRRQSFTEKLL